MSEGQFAFCDTTSSLLEAIEVIKGSPYVVLDCEGQNLEDPNGPLSLISCRASGQSFLIDVKELLRKDGQTHLRQLFDVLESPDIPKLMFDGRQDFCNFVHGYNVHLNGVLDLQVADLKSRTLRGEGEAGQLKRLKRGGYIHARELSKNRILYLPVHRLNGLFDANDEHRSKIDRGQKISHDHWFERPLQPTLLTYAELDLRAIETLYHHFEGKGYINRPQLFQQSQRYIEVWKTGYPPIHASNNLLPLNLIDQVESTDRFRCSLCARDLPRSCKATKSANRCFVCRAFFVHRDYAKTRHRK